MLIPLGNGVVSFVCRPVSKSFAAKLVSRIYGTILSSLELTPVAAISTLRYSQSLVFSYPENLTLLESTQYITLLRSTFFYSRNYLYSLYLGVPMSTLGISPNYNFVRDSHSLIVRSLTLLSRTFWALMLVAYVYSASSLVIGTPALVIVKAN
jgi:hypothetical protein